MKIDVFTSAGKKEGSLDLPASMFEAPINKGLMHLALVRQQSNRRRPIAHVKHRGEVVGTTKKAYAQKHTGNARRGALRSPLLKGGGKSFGPRNEANFRKEMPKKMRRAALFSCLSLKAKEGAILGLQSYPKDPKTKALVELLRKLPVEFGRRIVLVTSGSHRELELAARNVPRIKTLYAEYLNPEDVLQSKHMIFLVDAVKRAEETFGKRDDERLERKGAKMKKSDETAAAVTKENAAKKEPKAPKAKKAPAKAASTKKPKA